MAFNRMRLPILLCLVIVLRTAYPGLCAADMSPVRVWEEKIVIPTYVVGEPEPNPMFYFGRASQGAEGRVYPYALYDKLTDQKVDETYTMVYLENQYVKIGILPEIGGRVFEAIDKTNNYSFFYRQRVIKPALIGLTGAWISGGVEWNIPHHHRASTFLPVQYRAEENYDGSKTIWVGELELRHRTRWAIGYTLRPGKSYLEVSVRILNRMPVANSILCFANVAVHANENYQVIFPPSTQHVTHHAKREFTTWPVATTMYGRYDFSAGVDVSWYKNHSSWNSMFAWNYEDDFFAGYDHGRHAGTMSFADHHIVPGKKLWTWGNDSRGRMWDKTLTDDDGPYIELMVGAYSDNQPDYSWMQPYEVKSFRQYWYPFRDIGGVKNANLDAAVNLDMDQDRVATVGFYTTSAHSQATILVQAGDEVFLKDTVPINPETPYVNRVSIPADVDEQDLRASISVAGRELIVYSPTPVEPEPMPEPVRAPPPPEDIETNEELYLTGLRIEQFHNPALEPHPYWEEAPRRDPGDVRVNTAFGINLLKRARFGEAETLFRKALDRLTARYTTPKNGEPFYYLGVALKSQGKMDAAFDAFYKATWSAAWRAPGYYSLAEIACYKGDLDAALDFVERSLEANALNIRAINLKSAVLRHMDRPDEAIETLVSALTKSDPLDVRAMTEYWLATESEEAGKMLRATLKDHPATGLETAVEYANAGLWRDATAVLLQMVEKSRVSPMVYYYLGYFAGRYGQDTKAREYFARAETMPPDYVFPFQYEAIDALRCAMDANDRDARAPYYLGNLLYDWQPEEATKLWERSVLLDDSFPVAHRNLAVAYSHRDEDNALEMAVASLERAVELGDGKYPTHLFELDVLYQSTGTAPEKRLAVLEKYQDAVLEKDDALAREIELKVCMGKYEEAVELISGRYFDIWEGGGRFNMNDCWTSAHLLRGHNHFANERYREALADYRASTEFPESLRTGLTRDIGRHWEVDFWIGTAYEALNDPERAEQAWRRSAAKPPETREADYAYARDVQLYYHAQALAKLGRKVEADVVFNNLVQAGTRALARDSKMDFFAKFGEHGSRRVRLANAHYLTGLGYLGLDEKNKAEREFRMAVEASPDHIGARTALDALD